MNRRFQVERVYIKVSIEDQTLSLFNGDETLQTYSISTAKKGAGERMGSECTPCGEHIISKKIGEGCELNAVFIGRIPTGEIYTPALAQSQPGRDWILTRILWLSGTEKGKNKGGNVDSHDRYIYIHGSPDEVDMGKPGSRGCIRMHNKDIIELFGAVAEGSTVLINK